MSSEDKQPLRTSSGRSRLLVGDARATGVPGAASPLDLRILSYYPEIRAIQAGAIPFPRMAILYPVYGCNLDCLGCEYGADNAKGFVMLDSDRFLRLVDELAGVGVEGIEFCGGGEPTLHPAFIEAVEHGAARGVRFGLLTNGTALAEEFRRRALPHFAYVRVTLDAADEETYARVRPAKGRNPWKKVLGNIAAMVEERRRRELCLDLSVKFLVSRENRDDLRAAVQLARDLGVDAIQFKALRLHPAELSHVEELEVDAELAALRAEFPGVGIVGSVRKLAMTRSCMLTPLQVTVDARGDVYLCCYFRHRAERHAIGNVYDQAFRELWASDRHRAAIAGIDPSECSALDCRFIRYHDVVDAWMKDDQFSFI